MNANAETMPDQAATAGDVPAETAAPLRRCIASGESLPRDTLLRFVVGPDGVVVPDVADRLPGRGLWLSPDRDHINTATSKNLFARAARRSVCVPDDLADQTERLLARRAIDLLSLARRAGQAVAGFEKARGWVAEGRAALQITACDGASDGARKIRGSGRDVPRLVALSGEEIGRAFGRDFAVHAAVASGGLADGLKNVCAKLAGVRQAASQ